MAPCQRVHSDPDSGSGLDPDTSTAFQDPRIFQAPTDFGACATFPSTSSHLFPQKSLRGLLSCFSQGKKATIEGEKGEDGMELKHSLSGDLSSRTTIILRLNADSAEKNFITFDIDCYNDKDREGIVNFDRLD